MKKVLLGMSGGVDSSVAAVLLKKQGYEVVGVTLKLCGDEKNIVKTINDAKSVCERLKIEHHIIDLRKDFEKSVINNFKSEYMNARTPNPCIECNKYIKFGELYKYAQEFGCEYIATGHYAKIIYSEEYKQYVLTKSKANEKDQTYFLYGINKELLPKIIFPLSDFESKSEIREIAKVNNLDVANKKDSQEICFIQNNDYVAFLKQDENFNSQDSGNIILKDGTIVGKHNGLIHYTIGQRKGLGISYDRPLYVIELDSKKNQVVVGEEKELYSKKLYANQLNFLIDIENFSEPISIKAKIRYRAKEASAILYLNDKENNIAMIEFEEPQRAITPGQSVVFYIDEVVLGGGKIL